jgi:NAD(P)-dependent dehydrogenase (short-subunit alcohol dehydrogenase family)
MRHATCFRINSKSRRKGRVNSFSIKDRCDILKHLMGYILLFLYYGGLLMAKKTVIITGASDGIGASAARTLNQKGARVVIVGRSPEKTGAIAKELGVDFFTADFTDLLQVRVLAANLLNAYPHIDVLVNNAGLTWNDRTITKDGHEIIFQVNHLAPFLLTNLLKDRLIASRASIIFTSSVGHKFGHVNLGDLESEHKYSALKAYSASKLENILFMRELSRRWGAQGISTAAFHPGNIASHFASEAKGFIYLLYNSPMKYLFLSNPEKGADTLVWLADGEPGRDWISGEYYFKRKTNKPSKKALDPVLAGKLWDISEKLVGI